MNITKVSFVSPEKVVNIDVLKQDKSENIKKGPSFVAEIGAAIKKVDACQKEADQAMKDGAINGAEDIHEAMIRLQEAEISLRMFMQVKNKAIEAYREIMRMQL